MTYLKRKVIRIHVKVERELNKVDRFSYLKILELLDLLSTGESLGMPMSRPMPVVAHGVHELRVKSVAGELRLFYFVKLNDALLVFHFFVKKTQKTPPKEIKTAIRRLGEML